MKSKSFNEKNMSDVCVWNEIFNDDERHTLQNGFLLTGLITVVLSIWLSGTIRFTSLRFNRSYGNLANFITVACIRRAVPLILHLFLYRRFETLYTFQRMYCEIFAFLETFLAVFEVESLTHVCIERYVNAKYLINGWQLKEWHYDLYFCLCLFFSCAYSMPPLFGVGRYAFDFQCTSCTFDVILPHTWHRYLVITIFVLRSIKPSVFMTLMLVWASVLESKLPCSMKHHQQFTWSIIVITVINLLCWAPIAVIRGNILVSQLMFADYLPMLTSFNVMWAMWIHWLAPALTAIALFLVDESSRNKLSNLHVQQNEGGESEMKKE